MFGFAHVVNQQTSNNRKRYYNGFRNELANFEAYSIKKLGMKGGEKLLVLTCDGDIALRKAKQASLDDLGERIDRVVKEEHIYVEKLVAEVIEWEGKSK